MLTFLQVSGLVYTVNEPKLKYTANKMPVVNFTVVSNRAWTDEGGSKHEDSCFIDCVVFKSLAEAVDKNVHKGDPLFIEGNLKLERWESDDQKHSKHSIMVSRVIFLKPRDPDSSADQSGAMNKSKSRKTPQSK
jgi:single-strand DNA-binding protein